MEKTRRTIENILKIFNEDQHLLRIYRILSKKYALPKIIVLCAQALGSKGSVAIALLLQQLGYNSPYKILKALHPDFPGLADKLQYVKMAGFKAADAYLALVQFKHGDEQECVLAELCHRADLEIIEALSSIYTDDAEQVLAEFLF